MWFSLPLCAVLLGLTAENQLCRLVEASRGHDIQPASREEEQFYIFGGQDDRHAFKRSYAFQPKGFWSAIQNQHKKQMMHQDEDPRDNEEVFPDTEPEKREQSMFSSPKARYGKRGFSFVIPDSGMETKMQLQGQKTDSKRGFSFSYPQPEEEKRGFSFSYPQKEEEKRGFSFSYPQKEEEKRGFSFSYPQKEEEKRGFSFTYPKIEEEKRAFLYRQPLQNDKKDSEFGFPAPFPSNTEKSTFTFAYPKVKFGKRAPKLGSVPQLFSVTGTKKGEPLGSVMDVLRHLSLFRQLHPVLTTDWQQEIAARSVPQQYTMPGGGRGYQVTPTTLANGRIRRSALQNKVRYGASGTKIHNREAPPEKAVQIVHLGDGKTKVWWDPKDYENHQPQFPKKFTPLRITLGATEIVCNRKDLTDFLEVDSLLTSILPMEQEEGGEGEDSISISPTRTSHLTTPYA